MINLGRNSLECWDDIQYVLAVARTGSFFAAGERLRTNQSTVSRRVQRLEKRLGAKLFDRYSHGMRLTPAGTGLVEKARNMEAAANEIERHLAGVDQKMVGPVRIAVPDGISTHWLTPTLLEFQTKHPQLCIELIAGTAAIDFLSREADIAIRLNEPKDERWVASRVGHVRFSLFADRKYLDRFGKPETIDDLRTHRLVDHITYSAISGLQAWQAYMANHPQIVFRPNTSSAFLVAVRTGYGIGLFPDFYCFVAPDLVKLDLEVDAHAPLWLLSHTEIHSNARVKAVFNFLVKRFRQDRRMWFS